jgi:hypothetical protein
MKRIILMTIMIMMLWGTNSYGGICDCCDCDDVERERVSNRPILGGSREVVVCNSEELRRHFTSRGDCRIVIKFPIRTEREMRAGAGRKTVVYANHAFDFNNRERVNARTGFEYDGMYDDSEIRDVRIREPRVLP